MDENTRNDTLIEVVQDPFIVDLLKELPFFPLTPRVPLKQTMKDKYYLNRIICWAKEEYPSLPEADFALEIYAQKYKEEGILFLGDDGERKMWGPGKPCLSTTALLSMTNFLPHRLQLLSQERL